MRRLLPPLAVGFVTALVLVAAVAIYAARTASDQFLYLPDPAQDVAPVISVTGETPDPPVGGHAPGVLFVAITLRRASLLESWFPSLREHGSDLVDENVVQPRGQTDQQRQREGEADMSQSQKVAAAVALRALGRDVKIAEDGVRVDSVVADAPAGQAGILAGDVVVAANGVTVEGSDDLRGVMEGLQPGAKVALRLERNGDASHEETVTTGTIASPQDAHQAVMGIAIEDNAVITLPVDVKYDTKSIGGPSAGLPFALEIYNALSDRSLVRGHRIAATGVIRLDGTVEPIGAAKQKAIGASEAGADVFLVPTANAAEARKGAPKGLTVIPVGSFAEALKAIQALPALAGTSQQAAR